MKLHFFPPPIGVTSKNPSIPHSTTTNMTSTQPSTVESIQDTFADPLELKVVKHKLKETEAKYAELDKKYMECRKSELRSKRELKDIVKKVTKLEKNDVSGE